MRRAPLLLAALLAGCASPLAPEPPPHALLAPALAHLDALPGVLPWNGRSMRDWRRGVTITTAPLPRAYGAVWDGSAVVINADLTGYDAVGVAGLIAHELRHADGARHECGPDLTQDRRTTPWSAYAVHVWTLDALGAPDQARGNEGGYCE
jgi:hypothetical protein